MKVGDLVEAIPPWALVCGSGRYSYAVVVSTEPFVMVSEHADMLWRNANLKDVKVIGRAPEKMFEKAMSRVFVLVQKAESQKIDERD